MTQTTAVRRARSKRGEGSQLRDEIIAAAGTLLEQTGRDDAVTLRAIARVVGITAPSIYQHFEDRDQIIHTLMTRTFDRLAATLRPAAQAHADPVARLQAVCRAYVAFATDHAHVYRVLFERHHTADVSGSPDVTEGVDTMVGADAFAVLLEAVRACVDSGASTASSPEQTAIQLWVGLHGLSTLRASMPYFPWPPLDGQLDDLVVRLVQLAAGRETEGGRRRRRS